MKKTIALVLSLAMLLAALAGCQKPDAGVSPGAGFNETPEPATAPVSPSPSEEAPVSPSPSAGEETELSCPSILFSVWGVLEIALADIEMYSSSGDQDQERVETYIEGVYGLSVGEWEDVIAIRETGASAVEMAVLRFADEDAAAHGYDCLTDYLHVREGDFADHAPDQAKLVADAALVSWGRYVGLFVVKNTALAERTFTDILEAGKLPEAKPEPEPTDDVNELLDALLSKCEVWGEDISGVERVDSSDLDKLRSIVEGEYGLDSSVWSEAAIARGTEGSVFEIAVLRSAEGWKPWNIYDVLVRDYLDVKEGEYARFPLQAELLSQAAAGSPGGTDIVIMAVCSGADDLLWAGTRRTGASSFDSATRHWEGTASNVDYDPNYPDRVLFTPPGKEDMSLYDTSAIRDVWVNGDLPGLSEHDRAVYNAAGEILGEILRDGMTDLEKETAIYTWLVNEVDYDWTHQDIMAETPCTSYQPYGGLVERTAVCLGYATSFQLLCDLAGVECITVTGACFRSEEDHAWNMVKLDGEWHCVDVTWDANYREQGATNGQPEQWRWFNLTSDELAKDHQWDYANVPEA